MSYATCAEATREPDRVSATRNRRSVARAPSRIRAVCRCGIACESASVFSGRCRLRRADGGRLQQQWSHDASSSTLGPPPTGTSVAALRATARAWANAFFVGSVDDIKALQGPECRPRSATTIAPSFASSYWRRLQSQLQTHLGRPLDQIKIRGVATRDVAATTGDALVEYDLPAAVVGNDNWVMYAVHGGRWQVADCHAPIGGESSDGESATTIP